MLPDVWIPSESAAVAARNLGGLATLHEYPPDGGWPDSRGRADLLVASLDIAATVDALAHVDGVRVVQTLTAGVDRIVDTVPSRVTLCDAAGVHDIGVAEWIVMAILAVNRRLPRLVAGQMAGTWLREDLRGSELAGSTVLILGYGSIGKALEKRLEPFGVTIVRVARRSREGVHSVTELPDLLPAADVVVVMLPLTPQTRGIVDAGVLGRMKRGALLVNAARGPIVDSTALQAALASGSIRAALDVTDPEPLPDGHPLWSAPEVLITPHIAGDVEGEEARAWALVADQVGRLTRGERLRNIVVDGY